MRSDERAALVHIVRRLERIERIRSLVTDRYEYVDDVKQRVRRAEVVAYVAERLGEVVNNRLYGAVKAAVKTLNWQPIARPDGRWYRKCRVRT